MDFAETVVGRAGPERRSIEAGFVPSVWISASQYAELRAQPALPRAAAEFAASLIDTYQGNTLLNALLCDRGRVMLGLYVLYLEALPFPGNEERGGEAVGATLGTVQSLCRETGLCSVGRVASVLAAMRFGGYIAVRTDPLDHRRRILAPTEKLVEVSRQHWTQQFTAMVLIFPGAAPVPARLRSREFRTAFLRELGVPYFAGFRVLGHVPVLEVLAESNAGLLLLSSLWLRQLASESQPVPAMPISVSALAQRFCVSRAHVRNMLAAAASRGLLAREHGSDNVFVLPALTEALLQFYGVLFLLFDRCAARAQGQLAQLAPVANGCVV
jgi:hypothetical protein